MNRFHVLAVASLIGLAGCPKDDTDESGIEDTDVALSIADNWDTDGYSITVTGLVGAGFDLGLAETGAPTGEEWYGEDCFEGTAGYNLCHGFTGNTGALDALGTGAAPGDPDDVVAGTTTLLNKDLAFNGDGSDRVTYMVTFDDTSCVTWGEDAAYYASFSCTAAPLE